MIRTVKLSELRGGEILIADGGFGCLTPDAHVIVRKDDKGAFYVRCASGQHFLDGQLSFDDNDTLVGLRLVC